MESELSTQTALSDLPDGRKYLLQYLPCSQFSMLSRTEPVLSHISRYIWRAAWITIRENTLTFIRHSQSPEPEAANFTSILIKSTSCTWRQPRTRLCLGPLHGLLVQWRRGEADEKFLSRRSQWAFIRWSLSFCCTRPKLRSLLLWNVPYGTKKQKVQFPTEGLEVTSAQKIWLLLPRTWQSQAAFAFAG